MRKILLILLLFPLYCSAQVDLKSEYLQEDRIDESTHDTIKRTFWMVLEHANLSRHLNTFFRISYISGQYFLDLKIMEGGDSFVVAKNAEFKLKLERDIVVTLYNEDYQKSCIGCGAKGNWGNGAQGVTLSFRMYDFDLSMLMNYYVEKVRLYCEDGFLERKVNDQHSELLMDQIYLVYNSVSAYKKYKMQL